MAGLTTFTSSGDNDAMRVSLWTSRLLYEASKQMFWDRFSGLSGEGMPVVWNTDLTAKRGDTVKVDFVKAASGAGVTDNTALATAEEEAVFYQLDVPVVFARNAFAVHEADQQKTMHELSAWGRRLASTWIAGKIDDAITDVLDANTASRVYPGSVTAKNNLTSSDKLTLTLVSQAAAKARDLLIQPMRIDGEEWLVMLISNWAYYDLRVGDATAYQAAMREAEVRGKDNPLFRGVAGCWDGVMLVRYDRVETGSNAGSGANVDYAICHLVGANAAAFGWAMPPTPIMDNRDYGAITGVGVKAMYGAKCAVFNSVAIGHLPVMVAAADPNA